MSTDVNKNVEVEEVEVTELAVVEEEVQPTFVEKVKAGFKKHAKKLAVAGGVAALGIAAYALGKKAGSSEDCDVDYDFDDDEFEIIDLDVETTEE